MSLPQDELIIIAERYWKIRNSGDLSDARTQAHNVLLDALEMAGIPFIDREDAANIGREIIAGTFVFPADATNLMINIDPALKAQFKRAAKRYGGMTAVLLRLINEFMEKEVRA